MVRGIMTQHVMQAVSKEMFAGAQGRQLVDQTLPQIDQSAWPTTEAAAARHARLGPEVLRRSRSRRAAAADRSRHRPCRTTCTRKP